MTTLQDIQTLIDNTPANGTCMLPGGTFTFQNPFSFNITKPITILGNNTVFTSTDVNLVPTKPFFNLDSLLDGTSVQISDLTINGPITDGLDSYTESIMGAIQWSRAKTWNSKLVLNNITTTGAYGYGVQRAGGGAFEVKNCSLSGWVGGIAFFESHGGWGDMILRDTTLNAPLNSKYSSIGMYIHPHLHLNAERVSGSNWNRYVIYLNGTPQSAGHHDLIEVTATNCGLVQTGSSSVTTLIRCIEQGIPKNGGSYFKGPVLSVGSTWAGKGMIGFLNNNDCVRTFVGDIITPQGRFAAFGNGTIGKMELINCDVELNGTSSLVSISNTSTAAIELNSVLITGNTTKLPLVIEGGTLKVINGQLPANSRIVLPGVLI